MLWNPIYFMEALPCGGVNSRDAAVYRLLVYACERLEKNTEFKTSIWDTATGNQLANGFLGAISPDGKRSSRPTSMGPSIVWIRRKTRNPSVSRAPETEQNYVHKNRN